MNYFAAKEPKEAVSIILDKAQQFYNFQNFHGLLDKLRNSWRAYHGAYYNDVVDSHTVGFTGEQGEYATIAVNHYRNIAQHMLVMTTSSRPSMQARAINTDYKSQVQAKIADGVLDYYMREKDVETYIKNTVECAIVLGTGYLKLEWDANAGEIYDFEMDEQGNLDKEKPIREGDLKFTTLSPFDVVLDSYKENADSDWIVCRTFKNKYDLAARYPDLKDKIEGMQTKSDLIMFKFTSGFSNIPSDEVPVYEFYHKKTDSLPNGRYILFLDMDIVLHDGPMPYRDIPIIRVAPSEFMGTPYGYSPMFDLLPLQEAVNSLYSTILTNHNAFGVQNVVVTGGSDVVFNSLEGGLNIIEVNPGADVKPLNLTQTPKEIFDHLNMLIRDMETLSGINSTTRGNPEASLRSGSALALVQSLALQFSSNLQHQYIKCIEKTGGQIIKILQDFALAKRTVSFISGVTNKTEVKEFNSDDLTNISRVLVDVANPLSRTTSGKLQIAESLLQYQLLKDPQQYLTIVNTGRLDAATESTTSKLDLIRRENEFLLEGKQVIAIATDEHVEHINSHKSVLDDPDIRTNPDVVQKVLAHITEHINLLQTTDPNLLISLGQQPIQSPPPPVQNINPNNAPVEVMQQEGQPTSVQGLGLEGSQTLPKVPNPPAPFENAPVFPNQQ